MSPGPGIFGWLGIKQTRLIEDYGDLLGQMSALMQQGTSKHETPACKQAASSHHTLASRGGEQLKSPVTTDKPTNRDFLLTHEQNKGGTGDC